MAYFSKKAQSACKLKVGQAKGEMSSTVGAHLSLSEVPLKVAIDSVASSSQMASMVKE